MSTVLVYSDDPRVRERVLLAVGRRPDPDIGPIEWVEAGDAGTVTRLVDAGGIDVCVLDAEAAPTGGMGRWAIRSGKRSSVYRPCSALKRLSTLGVADPRTATAPSWRRTRSCWDATVDDRPARAASSSTERSPSTSA